MSATSDNWIVIESTRQPAYNFAVANKDGEVIAYTFTRQAAEGYAAQMNEKGFIEP